MGPDVFGDSYFGPFYYGNAYFGPAEASGGGGGPTGVASTILPTWVGRLISGRR